MTILHTERLLLRRFQSEDLDALYQLVYADPTVKQTWSSATGTPDAIKQRFATNHVRPDDPFGFRAVVLRDSDTLIGLMGFQRHEPGEGADIAYLLSTREPQRRVGFDPRRIDVELTYALGRSYWKHGYATEMGRALIAHGFETLGIGRIIQGVLSTNQNSVQLMQRLGFRIEQGLQPNQTVGVLEADDRWRQNDGATPA